MEEPEGWWDEIVYSSDPDEENEIWITVWDHYTSDRIIATCANCGQYIFEGEGNNTVHYACEYAFIEYLNRKYPIVV